MSLDSCVSRDVYDCCYSILVIWGHTRCKNNEYDRCHGQAEKSRHFFE